MDSLKKWAMNKLIIIIDSLSKKKININDKNNKTNNNLDKKNKKALFKTSIFSIYKYGLIIREETIAFMYIQ